MSSTVVSLTPLKAQKSSLPNTSSYAGPRNAIWRNSIKSPKVSIIIPLYNKEKYIGECIKSILDQSFNDFEIIIVNDGSTDQSSGAIPRGDERLNIIHTINHGASSARNTGLAQARGEYVMFVDADDTLEPYALFYMVSAMDEMDMVIGSFRKTGAMNTKVIATHSVKTREELFEYVFDNLINPSQNQLLNGCWAKLFRRKIITEHKIHFPIFMRTAEDMGFNYSYLQHVKEVEFIPEVVYNNRKHSDYSSLSTRFNLNDPYGLFGFVIGLSYVRAFLRDFVDEIGIDKAISQSYIYHTILYFIRICGQAKLRQSLDIVQTTMKQAEFMRRMAMYDTPPGTSRLIAWLMGKGWVRLTILACWLKARRAYGR